MKAVNYSPEFIQELLNAANQPPEKTFDNIEDLLRWLDMDDEISEETI